MDLKAKRTFLIAVEAMQLLIVLSEPDATQTLLWGDGLTVVRAGEISTFSLQTRNAAGENATADVSEIAVSCVSHPDKPADFCSEDPAVIATGSGQFRVEFVVGRFWATEPDPFGEGIFPNPLPEDFYSATDDRIHVTVGGDAVPGSPFAPLFLGGAEIDPVNCLVRVSTPILFSGIPGGMGEFHQIRDTFGNNIRPSQLVNQVSGHLTLTASFLWSAEEDKPPLVTASWILTNWYIDFQAICYVAGRYLFEAVYSHDGDASWPIPIQSNNDDAPQSSVAIDCAPGEVEKVVLELQGDDARLGSDVVVIARAHDAYGNAAYFGEAVKEGALAPVDDQSLDDIEIRIEHESCNCALLLALEMALSAVTPGVLSIRFSTASAGRHTVRVLYKNVDAVSHPLEIEFQQTPPPVAVPEAAPVIEPSPAPASDPSVEAPSPSAEPARQVDQTTSEVDAAAIASDKQIELRAGESKSFLAYLRDEQRLPVEGNTLELTAWLINRQNPMEGLVQLSRFPSEDGDVGTYTVEISTRAAATYDLLVTYQGIPIRNAYSSVVVRPSHDVSPERSFIVGSAIGVEVGREQYLKAEDYRQTAGTNMSLIITAVDPYGNEHTSTKPGFELNDAIRSAASWMQVFEFEDGKTRFYFSIEKSGLHDLRVKFGAATVYRATLEVSPAEPFHSNCRVFDVQSVVAGEEGEGFLQVQDRFANIYGATYKDLINTTQFYVALRHDGSVSVESAQPVVLATYSTKRDALRFSYRLTQSGIYKILAQLEDVPIQGNGDTFRILPSNISYEQTRAADVPAGVVAGDGVEIRIVARDRYGNVATEEMDLPRQTQVDITSFAESASVNATTAIAEVHPGLLTATVNLTAVGRYTFRIRIDGNNISTGNASFAVHSAAFDAAASIIVVANEVIVGEWNDVLLLPRDRFGNALASLSNVSLLVNVSDVDVRAFERDGESGWLSSQYRIGQVGNFSLDVLQNASYIWRFSISAVPDTSNNGRSSSVKEWWRSDIAAVLMITSAIALFFAAYWIFSTDTSAESEDDTSDDAESSSRFDVLDAKPLVAAENDAFRSKP